MKYLFRSFCFILFMNFCSCATMQNPNATHSDHPGKCYEEIGEHVFDVGEVYTPIGHCIKFMCTEPGYIVGHSCGKVKMTHCEILGKDLTQPYPFCCDRFLCKYANGTEYIKIPQARNAHLALENNDNNL